MHIRFGRAGLLGAGLMVIAYGACTQDTSIEPVVVRHARESEWTSAGYRAIVQEIQLHYRVFGNGLYRSRMQTALRHLDDGGPSTTYERLVTLLDVATESGADGLEGLVLSHVDTLMRSDDRRWRDATVDLLRGVKAPSYKISNPALDLTIPVARFDSRVIVSVRVDVARQLLRGLWAKPTAGDLEVLLGLPDVREHVCDLPLAAKLNGIAADIANADVRRQQACDDLRGTGSGGEITLMAGIAVDGCTDLTLSDLDQNDDYTDAERLADLEECIGDLTASNTSMTSRLSDVWDRHFEAWNNKDEGTWIVKTDDNYDVIIAVKDDDGTFDLFGASSTDLEYAVAYAEWQAGLGSMMPEQPMSNPGMGTTGGSSGTTGGSSGTTGDSTGTGDGTSSGTTGESMGTTGSEGMDPPPPSEGDDGTQLPGEGGSSSEACERLSLNGITWAETKLGEDWASFGKRLDPVINPSPIEPEGPADGFGLSHCGGDAGTNRNICAGVVDCLEGDSCGCPWAPGETLDTAQVQALAASLARTACNDVHCADGTQPTPGTGMTCACTPIGGSSADPDVGPIPFPINEAIVGSLYFASIPLTSDRDRQPLDAAAEDIFRR